MKICFYNKNTQHLLNIKSIIIAKSNIDNKLIFFCISILSLSIFSIQKFFNLILNKNLLETF